MQPNDKPTFQAVGSFAQLATAAGGLQPAPGANALNPATAMQLPTDFAQAPLSAMSVNSDFAAFAAVTKEAANPASNIPPGPTPDLSKRDYPAINVSTTISGK